MAAGSAGADPLAGLLELPGVAESLDAARGAIDTLLWDRSVKARQAEVVAESALRGVWANAWFEGAETGLPALRSGAALDSSPIGRLLAGTLAMHAELPALVPVVGTAPAQALARMHTLVARGFVADDELGRPRSGTDADDPLRIGVLPAGQEVAQRLAAVGRLLSTSTAPGVLVAVVVHAELAALRPFTWGSGLVARAALRLVLAQRGVDPGMLAAPELGLRAAGRPAYVRALRGYAAGTPEGVGDMIRLVAGAVEVGGRQPRGWVDEG
jgi:hypothetical protein